MDNAEVRSSKIGYDLPGAVVFVNGTGRVLFWRVLPSGDVLDYGNYVVVDESCLVVPMSL